MKSTFIMAEIQNVCKMESFIHVLTVVAREAFQKNLTSSFPRFEQSSEQFLTNEVLKSSLKVSNFLFIDQSNFASYSLSILIGQLTGSRELFKKLFKLYKRTLLRGIAQLRE